MLFLELHTSWTQAHVLSYVARRMTFHVVRAAGTPAIPVATGPYDNRLGYAGLRKALDNLQQAGYRVQAHAQSSGLAQEATKLGLPPIYREKTQAGLRIEDGSGRPIYHAITPHWTYPDYQSIPQLIVRSLLFAENREILDTGTPYRNPAIEWDRLTLAVFDFGVSRIYHGHSVTGGSAVPTQLEKLRHSPGGRTTSPGEKFRQMLTASLRAYQDGPQSLAAREQIVSDYINSLPLAATRQHGEVIGLADGLYVPNA